MSWQTKLPITDSQEDIKKRQEYWVAMDLNKNKYLSLAEFDKGLRDVIQIPELFELKPVVIQAYNTAKAKLKASSAQGDNLVSQAEFKYLLIYLAQYYDYWTVFKAIDTSKDHKVSLEEFKNYVPTLQKYGVHIDEPQAAFKEIDANHGNFVTFDQFCKWAIIKNLDVHKE